VNNTFIHAEINDSGMNILKWMGVLLEFKKVITFSTYNMSLWGEWTDKR
jgi:hypothetical protein